MTTWVCVYQGPHKGHQVAWGGSRATHEAWGLWLSEPLCSSQTCRVWALLGVFHVCLGHGQDRRLR